MVLTYKFKREKLERGGYVQRPKILVTLQGSRRSVQLPALIDSGCDAVVVPQGVANLVGLKVEGEKNKLIGFREEHEVVVSSAMIILPGRVDRQSVSLQTPVLVTLEEFGCLDDFDIVLGIAGFFDKFDVTFKKSRNRIILKQAS